MIYWQEKNTVDFIKKTEAVTDTGEKYIRLHELAASTLQKVEQRIRVWGLANETVRKYLQQVDK